MDPTPCRARLAGAAFLCVAWLSASFSSAAQYFVAPDGSDGAGGSVGAPWATLQHAADVVGPGDRVTVRAGDYTGFYLSTSGAAGSPIEFVAEPGARITQRNAITPDGINLEGASYVVVDGFEVRTMPRTGVRAAGLPDAGMSHVTIRNVLADRNRRWGIFTGFVDDLLVENNETRFSQLEHGIYVSNSGDRPVIRGNIVHDNYAAGIHMNGDVSQGGDGVISGALVSRNVIYGNGGGGGSGINMDGVQNSRIENNLLYGNIASGISLYQGDGGGPSTGNVVVNNTVMQPNGARAALNLQNGAANNTAVNNIFGDPSYDYQPRAGVDVSADSLPGLVSDFNVAGPFTVDGGDTLLFLTQWQALTGQDLHSPSAASIVGLFGFSGSAGGFRLWPGGVAIDAGTSAFAPAVDLAGFVRPRGSAVDIGAYEYSWLRADFNVDGVVDGADLVPWSVGAISGTGNGPTKGDATGDLRSDGADLLVWQRELGQSALGASLVVPEPTSASFRAAEWISVVIAGKSRRLAPLGR
jgi:parallel beta-helix repeat protein